MLLEDDIEERIWNISRRILQGIAVSAAEALVICSQVYLQSGLRTTFFPVESTRAQGFARYFTTTCDTPDGDPKLLEMVVQEMNANV